MRFCDRPFKYIEIGVTRDGVTPCYSCCPTILPDVVGDLSKSDLLEIWNSDKYLKIRESILDGSFRYCNQKLCPEIQSGAVDNAQIWDDELWDIIKSKQTVLKSGPSIVNLAHDRTCNLACPSCREEFIVQNDVVFNDVTDRILDGVADAKRIIVCSSGDPFASSHYKKLLQEFDFDINPNLKVQLVTNGVLFDEAGWKSIQNVHDKIEMVCISVDAACHETYNTVRRGGDWNKLMDNLHFISKLREQAHIPFVRLDFVVQNINYQEMPAFVDLCKKFNFDQVFFQKIVNWGTFSQPEFQKHAIYCESHVDYKKFLATLSDPRMSDLVVNLGNLGHFKKLKNRKQSFNFKNAIVHTFRNQIRKLQLTMRK